MSEENSTPSSQLVEESDSSHLTTMSEEISTTRSQFVEESDSSHSSEESDGSYYEEESDDDHSQDNQIDLQDLSTNANGQNHDELISSFLEIAVGHTVETARRFLQATQWKLDRAINLYLMHSSRDDDTNAFLDSRTRTRSSSDDQVSEESTSDLLFRPPHGMVFEGSFEEAKYFSSKKNQWLLVNIQSKREFASHALNRDVWSDETVMRMVGSKFMLLQVYDHATKGQKVCSFYKITSVPPVILLIDPVTGQKLNMWNGVTEVESFVEDLKKFQDVGPNEHIASTRNMRLRIEDTSDNNVDKVAAPSWGEEFENEDSLNTYAASEDEEEETLGEEFEGLSLVSPEKEETCLEFPDLTEEPKGDCDRSLVCSLCVRFPDGRRKQRKFLKSEPVQLLWSFCYSHMEEYERKVFKLVHAIPGASKTLDYEADSTFDQSGLDNSMISVTLD